MRWDIVEFSLSIVAKLDETLQQVNLDDVAILMGGSDAALRKHVSGACYRSGCKGWTIEQTKTLVGLDDHHETFRIARLIHFGPPWARPASRPAEVTPCLASSAEMFVMITPGAPGWPEGRDISKWKLAFAKLVGVEPTELGNIKLAGKEYLRHTCEITIDLAHVPNLILNSGKKLVYFANL
jgi:hypothetical protein